MVLGYTLVVYIGRTCWYYINQNSLFRVCFTHLCCVQCICSYIHSCVLYVDRMANDSHFKVYLSYNNVSALKMLAAKNNWVLASKKNHVSTTSISSVRILVHTIIVLLCIGQVSLYTVEENQSLCFRVEFEIDVPAHRAFTLVSDLSRRQEWDQHYTYVFLNDYH